MAYNEKLAMRIRTALKGTRDLTEKKMFGGLSFLHRGNMCCGIIGNRLMVRVGPERYQAALRSRHTRPMDFTGRPLTGYLYVMPAGYATKRQLSRWLGDGMSFARTLPRKKR